MVSDSERVPRLIVGVDITQLTLTPLEGFVLSRIDGSSSVALLSDLTNLPVEDVSALADKLIAAGVAEWVRERVSLPRATGRPPMQTPVEPLPVPPSLRRTGPARPRATRSRSYRPPSSGAIAIVGDGVHTGGAKGSEETVDTSRRSHHRAAARRSHTGSLKPVGEIDDLVSEDTAPSAAAMSSVDEAIAQLNRAAASLAETPDENELPSEAASLNMVVESALLPPPGGRAPDADTPKREPLIPPLPTEGAPKPPRKQLVPPPSQFTFAGPSEPPEASGDPSEPPMRTPAVGFVSEETASVPDTPPSAPPEARAARGEPPVRAPAGGYVSQVTESVRDSFRSPAAAPSDPAPAAELIAEPDIDDEPPVEIDEDLDLPLDRQRRIDDLYYALDLLDHYQTLGVKRIAPRKEIRTAYFKLSKVFHPDTMFRKKLGSYEGKMEAVFKRLTEAYEVLGKKKRRVEYDRYLALQDKTRVVDGIDAVAERERLGRDAALAASALADDSPGAKVPVVAPLIPDEPGAARPSGATEAVEVHSEKPKPIAEPIPEREMSEEGRARQRKLIAQRLRNAASMSSRSRRRPVSRSPAPHRVSNAPVDRAAVLRNLTNSLRATADHTGGVDQASRYINAAKRFEAAGDLAEAADSLRLALAIEPDDQAVLGDYSRLQAELAGSLASTFEEQALYEQKNSKWAAAALSWGKVFEGRPTDGHAARMAAQALLNAKGDLRKAKQLAEAATELEPESLTSLTILARVFIAAKLTLNARRVLERAAELDPADPIVKNLLRDLSG